MAAALLDTPQRVLRRVQEYEDMELPSLPSFQHDLDFDSDRSMTYSEVSSVDDPTQKLPSPFNRDAISSPVSEATAVPERNNAFKSPSGGTTFAPSSSTVKGSPHQSQLPSVRYSDQFSDSALYLDSVSNPRRPSEADGSSYWGDSTNSEHLPPPTVEGQYSITKSDGLAGSSYSNPETGSYFTEVDTPIPRHYQQCHDSPRSAPRHSQSPMAEERNRIPSLSRSEISVTDNEATTPEQPQRVVEPSIVVDALDEEHYDDYNQTAGTEMSEDAHALNAAHVPSPAKLSLGREAASTPAPIRYMDVPSTAARAAATPFGGGATHNALRDVTPRFQNRVPFTPTPNPTPAVDYHKTPRAPLNDAERRKSHVLSVLASAAPVRTRSRNTPHPLRRASFVPGTRSIEEEDSAISGTSTSLGTAAGTNTGGTMASIGEADQTLSSIDSSFISIASSDDLTNRRGSRLHRLQHGNTSVPNILASPAGGLNLDSRPDAIKIQKHLNMMNRQLLESNAELAREAEEWRDECGRLVAIMRESGIDVDDSGIVGVGDKAHLGLGNLNSNSNPNSNTSLELPSISENSTIHNRFEDLRTEIREKDDQIAALNEKIKVLARRSSVSREGDGAREDSETNDDKVDLLRQLDETERAYADLQADFAHKTQEHAAQFAEICTGFEKQVQGLEDQLAAAKRERARGEALLSGSLGGEVLDMDVSRVRDELRVAREEAELARVRHDEDLEHIVQLEKQLHARESEVDELAKRLEARDAQIETLEKQAVAKNTLVADLEADLAHAEDSAEGSHSRLDAAKSDLSTTLARLQETEAECADLTRRLEETEGLAAAASEQIDALSTQLEEAEIAREDADAEVDALNARWSEMESVLAARDAQIGSLQSAIARMEKASDENDKLDEDAHRRLTGLEAELDAALAAIGDKEAEIESLRGKLQVVRLEQSFAGDESVRGSADTVKSNGEAIGPHNQSVDNGHSDNGNSMEIAAANTSLVDALQERLDEAHREIGRLRHEVTASPARKSALETRDARIRSLEMEKAALLERVKLRETPSPAKLSPGKWPLASSANVSVSTPQLAVNKVIANLRSPKTPGPMREFSWLQTTVGDHSDSMLRVQIEHLQGELQLANEQLDNNFSRLEEAGLGAFELAERLATAQDRIAALEDELRSLARENKRTVTSLDLGKNRAGHLEASLADAREQLAKLRDDMRAEKERLRAENARLQSTLQDLQAASDGEIDALRQEMEQVQDDAERRVAEIEARIKVLLSDKADVEAKLRANQVNSERAEREMASLRRMADEAAADRARVRDQSAALAQGQDTIRDLQDTTRSLQVQLRDQAAATDRAQKALEAQSAELDAVSMARDHLRAAKDSSRAEYQRVVEERDALKASSARIARERDLERDRAERAERDRERERQDSSSTAANAARANTLSRQLQASDRERDALRAECDELKAQRTRIARELAEFNADLVVQRRETAKFGAELEALRAEHVARDAERDRVLAREEERDRYARERDQAREMDALSKEREREREAQIRDREHRHAVASLEDRLHSTRERMQAAMRDAETAREKYESLLADMGERDDVTLSQRQKYKSQTRSLSAQITYLKAKYTRESTFRNALCLQKRFLLLLVGGMSLTEQATLRAIAAMGHGSTVQQPARPKRSLRSVGLAVVAVIRARKLADKWRQERASRAVVVQARSERERRRGVV